MPNFIDNNVTLPIKTQNGQASSPTKLVASDYKALTDALGDLRAAVVDLRANGSGDIAAQVTALTSSLNDTIAAIPPITSLNLKAAPYSAVGNGIADDRAALKSIFDDATTQKRTVFIPPGTFRVGKQNSIYACLNIEDVDNLTIEGVKGRTWIKALDNVATAENAGGSVTLMRLWGVRNVVVRHVGFDGGWDNAVTRISVDAAGYAPGTAPGLWVPLMLPQSTIPVEDTSDFPTSGTYTIVTDTGLQAITYTGKTAKAFTGCTGGTGEIWEGQVVGRIDWLAAGTTVASSMNGLTLPRATINVTDDIPNGNGDFARFPSSGFFQVTIAATGARVIVYYTGKSGGAFTGCTGGTGTLAAGDVIEYASGGGQSVPVQRDPHNMLIQFAGTDDGIGRKNNENVILDGCIFKNAYGDFVWIGLHSRNITLQNCVGRYAARNGVTLQVWAEDIKIIGCDFQWVVTQVIDSEPVDGPIKNVTIEDCDLRGWWNPDNYYGSVSKVVITIAGGTNTRPHEWCDALGYRVVNNRLYGGILLGGTRDVQILNNRIMCDFANNTIAPICSRGMAEDLLIADNYIYSRATVIDSVGSLNRGAIQINLYPLGETVSMQPQNVTIRGNVIHARNGVAGVHVLGAGGGLGESGVATSVTGTTLVKTGGAWPVDKWKGALVTVGALSSTVASNTSDTLTLGTVHNIGGLAWCNARGELRGTPAAGAFTIVSKGAVVDIENNDIHCANSDGAGNGGRGVTIDTSDYGPGGGRFRVCNNKINGAAADAIYVTGNVAYPLALLVTGGNVIYDNQPTQVTTVGIRIANPALVSRLVVGGGTAVPPIVQLAGMTSGQWLIEDGDVQRWVGYGDPNGVVTAPVSSTYARRDGDAGQRKYRKSGSSSPNTMWIPQRTIPDFDFDFDAKSYMPRPANATEMTKFHALAGVTSGNPQNLYVFTEASGTVFDKIGSVNLTPNASPLYQQTLTKQATPGVGFVGGVADESFRTGAGTLFNAATDDILVIALVEFGAAPAAERCFLQLSGSNNIHYTYGPGGAIRFYPSANGAGAVNYSGRGVIPIARRWNRTAGTDTFFSPFQKVSDNAPGTVIDGTKGIGDVGPGVGAPPGTKVAELWIYKGAPARKTDAEVKSIFEALGYYVAW